MRWYGIDVYETESVYPVPLRFFWQKLEIEGREYMQLASVELTEWGTVSRYEHAMFCIPSRHFAALIGNGIAALRADIPAEEDGTEDDPPNDSEVRS